MTEFAGIQASISVGIEQIELLAISHVGAIKEGNENRPVKKQRGQIEGSEKAPDFQQSLSYGLNNTPAITISTPIHRMQLLSCGASSIRATFIRSSVASSSTPLYPAAAAH
jgi:hypothetical protein